MVVVLACNINYAYAWLVVLSFALKMFCHNNKFHPQVENIFTNILQLVSAQANKGVLGKERIFLLVLGIITHTLLLISENSPLFLFHTLTFAFGGEVLYRIPKRCFLNFYLSKKKICFLNFLI